jgi:hypothetical protein
VAVLRFRRDESEVLATSPPDAHTGGPDEAARLAASTLDSADLVSTNLLHCRRSGGGDDVTSTSRPGSAE